MKLRNTLAIMAISIISAALFIGCGTSSKDAYESFSLLMDKVAGAGQWSDKGHAEKLQDGKLVVNGLTVNLPPVPMPEILKEAMAEATGQDIDEIEDQPRVMTFATVEVKNIVDKKAMANLLALNDWRDQKALKLADSVLLKGVTQQVPVAGDVMESSIEEVSLSAPALSAAGPEGPAGMPGFLKAFTLDKFTYKNFKMVGLNPQVKIDASIAEITAEKVAFDGTPFSVMDLLDPSGISGMATAMSSQSSSMNKAVVSIQGVGDQSEDLSLLMSIDSVIQKGTQGMGKVEELTMSGLKYDFSVKEKDGDDMPPITFSLASLSIKGFDMSAYLQKMSPLFEALFTNPNNANMAMAQIQTMGDFIVSPISLKELTVGGLELKAGDMFSIKLAEAGMTGPYTAGQIAPSQKSHFKGLEIVLPEDPKFAEGKTKEVYEFGKQFGMSRFLIEGEAEGTYDAESGLYSSRTTRLAVKDLFELSGGAELGGLTKDRVDTLNNTSLLMGAMAMQTSPDAIIGDLSFNKLNMKLDDHGLTNRILAYAAAQASKDIGDGEISVDTMRQMTIMTIKSALDTRGKEILANPEVLAEALVSYYTEPKSLELKLEATPPFSFKSFLALGGDKNKILDSFNISISANGKESPSLRFDID